MRYTAKEIANIDNNANPCQLEADSLPYRVVNVQADWSSKGTLAAFSDVQLAYDYAVSINKSAYPHIYIWNDLTGDLWLSSDALSTLRN